MPITIACAWSLTLVSMASSPTAGLFQTTVLTVREWLRRFQQQGLARPHRAFRAPHHQPGKTPADIEQVVALRQQLFTFSAQPFLATFVTRLAGMPAGKRHRSALSVLG